MLKRQSVSQYTEFQRPLRARDSSVHFLVSLWLNHLDDVIYIQLSIIFNLGKKNLNYLKNDADIDKLGVSKT